jgi:predicted RNA-binding protein with PIN domain
MRFLIDGYNVMYANGLLVTGRRVGPDRLRQVRHRFLNDLADALGPLDARQTTVVFDASVEHAPDGASRGGPHKGLSVVFAVDDADADSRIERLIAEHPAPKTLTVVSTDRRVRQAAGRRKARSVTADEFWSMLDARKSQRRRGRDQAPPPAPPSGTPAVTPEESAYWLREFADLDQQPETREALAPDAAMLTDEEIARIQREVDQETGGLMGGG